ncbi:hypothetical protein [Microbacterium testaceum]|uniref:hypothetical protein n=1 Tax=Microbacterium testaceum TaxID=2033 RepID=UPI002AC59115|nr:hypothetical protein [Microbacterium testaceum]MDZ5144758.1 hypothetical protein [Microbacterium testaceum]
MNRLFAEPIHRETVQYSRREMGEHADGVPRAVDGGQDGEAMTVARPRRFPLLASNVDARLNPVPIPRSPGLAHLSIRHTALTELVSGEQRPSGSHDR